MSDLAWVEVNGFPNYDVSSNGIVMSRRTGKRLYQTTTKCGYLQVHLWNNGKCRNTLVHRLVAEAFVPNPERKPQVNHKNGDKTDNRAENLEWVTASENQHHRYDNLGKKKTTWNVVAANDVCRKPVFCIETGEIFRSITDGARSMGKNASMLSEHLHGKADSFCGKHWRFVNE